MFLQEKLKLITVLGAGLLCGTALAVIIPEGVHALYEEILEGAVYQNSCCFLKDNPEIVSPAPLFTFYYASSEKGSFDISKAATSDYFHDG